ncbi:HAMP domain-containing sensor histidine kinase [Fusobacterium sp.]|uniref:sensor histidine kinase n=1 Tax=Fusobacterium sp. TaxID=68766 RepID=UPI00261B6790|nr:HAMP domain-containing sensor histidine kinase [Fusobacterium sp.]
MKKLKNIRTRIIFFTTIFIVFISITSISIVYYWSFVHFSKIFEDRVISNYALNQKKDLGIENEWILGVTTNSIDVVQSIHGEKVADIIENNAKSQKEISKLYKDKIDGKHLLYTIELELKNGETIYEYSVVKNIYADIFPKICLWFLGFILFLVGVSICYTYFVSKELYMDIKKLREYTKKITEGKKVKDIPIKTTDLEFQHLISDLKIMKETLDKESALRQTTLQYISHEMKTPLMIIEGYTTSAMDNLYPKGDLNSTLETIITQTHRMKQKVQDLITIIHLEFANNFDENIEEFNFSEVVLKVLDLLAVKESSKKFSLAIDKNITFKTNKEKVKILVENLITNQLKYSESFFSISTKTVGENLYLYFYNDGTSVPEKEREFLFSPFIKGYNGGSGLGLSICKSIVEYLEGDIYLAETKTGTLFVIKLPNKIN